MKEYGTNLNSDLSNMSKINIFHQEYAVKRENQSQLKGHKSLAFWFTGLSGSGKSTIANAFSQRLMEEKKHCYVLDGDNIRLGLNAGLGFSPEDRQENLRRIGEVSKLMVDAGLITIAAFVSPTISDRKIVREIIGDQDFIEVFVNTPLETCEQRDVKGLYKKARAGEIKNFTGIDAPYESPVNPDIELKTKDLSVEESVNELMKLVEGKIKL